MSVRGVLLVLALTCCATPSTIPCWDCCVKLCEEREAELVRAVWETGTDLKCYCELPSS